MTKILNVLPGTRRNISIVAFGSFAPLLFLLSAAILGSAIQVQFDLLPSSVIEQRLRLAVDKNPARENELRQLFQEAGCTGSQLTEQVVERKLPPNLACCLPGTTTSTIIVGAHTDHVRFGRGVVDDWSGAALLPSLYASLNSSSRKHTFIFVGFMAEEERLEGSSYFARHLSVDQIASIRAMVNLECLGLTPSKIWAHHADPQLLRALLIVAKATNLSIQGMNMEFVGDDDADSFRRRHIATVTIHSVTQETLPILHSRHDDFAAINLVEYYNSYRLIAAYLAYLDTALD